MEEVTVESTLPVSIEAASFRVYVSPKLPLEERGLAISGRHYIVEAIDEYGNVEQLSRVKSFKFEVDAQGVGLVTLTYIDHDKAFNPGRLL